MSELHRYLNAGCGKNLSREEGWVNLDKSPNVGADVVHDLEVVPLPFKDEEFDEILASHILEHIHNLIPLMGEFHRILKSNGTVLILCPHGGSDDAWEDLTHVRAFFPGSFLFFNNWAYPAGNHGNYDRGLNFSFVQERCELVPYAKFKGQSIEDLDQLTRHNRNIVCEMRIYLRKK